MEPITFALLVQYAPVIYVAIGIVGSGIETIGIKLNQPKLIEVGKCLEAISVDLPKLFERFKGILPSTDKK